MVSATGPIPPTIIKIVVFETATPVVTVADPTIQDITSFSSVGSPIVLVSRERDNQLKITTATFEPLLAGTIITVELDVGPERLEIRWL